MKVEFSLEILIDTKNDKNSIEVSYTYHGNKYDAVTFCNDKIVIKGERTQKKAITDCLTSDSNQLYKELRLCLVVHYLRYGRRIEKGKYLLTIGNQKQSKGKLKDRFDLMIFGKEIKEILFDRNDVVESIFRINHPKEIEVSLMNYIKGIYDKNNELNHFWKSFESISKFITKEKNEIDVLDSIVDMINNKILDMNELGAFVSNNKDVFINNSNIYVCKKLFSNRIGNILNKKKEYNSNYFANMNIWLSKCFEENLVRLIVNMLSDDLIKTKDKLLEKECEQSDTLIRQIDSFLSLPDIWNEYSHKYKIKCGNPNYPNTSFILYFIYCKRNEIFHGENTEPILQIKDKDQSDVFIMINCYLQIIIKSLYEFLPNNMEENC